MFYSFWATILVGFISFTGIFTPLNISLASLFHFSGNPPTNFGIQDTKLRDCPSTPNCVNSQNDDATHHIDPITYNIDRQKAKELLSKVLTVVPNTTIIEEKDNYIRTESASKIFGFVDDGEFYFPADKQVIEVRYSARLGESDLGVNRRRVEQIRLALEDLGINQ